MWHSAGAAVLYLPVGGWLQPLSSGGFPDSPDSRRRIKALLDASGLADRLTVRSAPPVTREDLLLVHPARYVDRFRALSDAGGGDIGREALFSRGGFEIACLSAGLAKAAVSDVLAGRVDNAYALSRPPGHHCLPAEGMGFCLLANVAIAVEVARRDFGLERIAVLDWDVHHGNGTQEIFYDRPDVLTISIHQENCFPQDTGSIAERGTGAGLGFNLNIPLPPGCGHEAYLHAMRRLVIPALRDFGPELIVIASGLDANAVDPLARQLLYPGSFREMTRMVMAVADELCAGRIVAVHEGGYSEAEVPFCALAIVEELSGIRTEVVDPFEADFIGQQPNARMVAFQCQLIDEMAAALHAG